ncbi:MAG TPA: sulfatase [Bacteroidales bacterium]|nr:sulfatase [Bacteroidales bacterium]
MPMMRAKTAFSCLPALSLLVGGCTEQGKEAFKIDKATPNVVIVTWHDTGRWFGCYGNEHVHTPNIDSLAARGVMFSNYWSTSSVCSPSRASMLTGRYPASNGVKGLAHPPQNYALHSDELHLSKLLRNAGYMTYLSGYQHECPHNMADSLLGFQEKFLSDPIPPGEQIADTFAYFARHRKANEGPFYAQIGFHETHRPFNFGGVKPDSSKGIYIPPYMQDTPEARAEISLFQGAIRKADSITGIIIDALRESGQYKNTLFVFTVDHGAHFPRAKASMYDPGMEVPLVMYWPDGSISGGKQSDIYSCHADFYPTLLDLIHHPIPSRVQGKSFIKAFYEDNPEPIRDAIYGTFIDAYRCVRTENYKLIWNFQPSPRYINLPYTLERTQRAKIWPFHKKDWPYGELYDLEKDPNEFHNLYFDPDYQEVVKELSTKMKNWMRMTGDVLLNGPAPTPWYERSSETLREEGK